MKEPLISIIVPIYNVEDYISECIESIQKQTYHNIQIILVDDGSSDKSGMICDEYAVSDPKIEVIHKENGGLVSARKAGLTIAKGQYIGFVDGDDYIAPDMYQSLIEELEISKADFVHSGYWENNLKKLPFTKKVIELSVNRKAVLEGVLFGLNEYAISYSIWSKLFRANLIKKSYAQVPNNCSNGEDIINLCICILECNKIALLDKAFYYYRVRNNSITHRNNIDTIENIIQLYEGLKGTLTIYGYNDKDIMNRFLWCTLFNCMGKISRFDFRMSIYYYSDMDKLQGRKVVIYGAGMVGKDYYAQISRYRDCEIVAWVDSNPQNYHYPNTNVEGLYKLDNMDFDMLIIAVGNENVANEIYRQLIKRGITQNKIFWSEPCTYGFDNLILN